MVTNGTVINCINLLKMGTTMADEYYLKAWFNYPYYTEDILERVELLKSSKRDGKKIVHMVENQYIKGLYH